MPLITSFLELENSLKINQLLSQVNQLNNSAHLNNNITNNNNNYSSMAASSILINNSNNNQLLRTTANDIGSLLSLNAHSNQQQLLFNQQKLLASKLSSILANNQAAAAAAVAASILNANGVGANANAKQINYSRYKTELCRQFTENGECKYSDKCQFAHGLAELKDVSRHPKYKTDLCKTFHSKGFCPYGPRCHFLHDMHEIADSNSSPPLLSKTTASSKSANNNYRQHIGNAVVGDVSFEKQVQQLSQLLIASQLKSEENNLDLVIRYVY